MQVHGGQLHEVEPAGIHAPLQEASIPHDAAVPETRSVPAPGADSLAEAPDVTRVADYTAVIEARVIAALHALAAHGWDVTTRGALLQESVAEVAERAAVRAGSGAPPLETTPPRGAAPQPGAHAPHRAANAGT